MRSKSKKAKFQPRSHRRLVSGWVRSDVRAFLDRLRGVGYQRQPKSLGWAIEQLAGEKMQLPRN